MNEKNTILVTTSSALLFCVLASPVSSYAAAPTARSSAEQELQRLTQQAQQLRQEVSILEQSLTARESSAVRRSRSSKGPDGTINLEANTMPQAGPHFGIDASYDGKRLVINEPSLHKDFALLRQKQHLNKAYGSVGDHGARVLISGSVTGDVVTHSNAFGQDEPRGDSTIYASGVLDIAAQVNDWWTAYTEFAGDTDDSNLAFKQGFVTLGNLDCAPAYGSLGYLYVPNGGYSTEMISSSLPKALGRTRARAMSVGYYHPTGVHATMYGQVGRTETGNSESLDQWGGDLRYAIGDFRAGISYQSNLSSSDGMKTPFSTGHTKVDHYVDAIDVRATYKFAPFRVAAEYLTAVDNFAKIDLMQNSHSVRPSASMVEAAYDFKTADQPSYLALSGGRSHDSLALKMPRYQYGATYGVHLFKNTIVALEYMLKRDYQRGATTAAGSNTVIGTGNIDHAVTAEINVYF